MKTVLNTIGVAALLLIVVVCNAASGGDSADAEVTSSQKASRRNAKQLEEELQKSLPGVALRLSGDVRLELARVEAGTFMMGSPASEKWRWGNESLHQVTLTCDFYIGRTEVTQAQWKAVMGTDPSYFKGDDRPVVLVSWNDAMEFCDKLNRTGKAPKGWKFTLPTEAQWEYACRGGHRSRGFKYSGGDDLDSVAWNDNNSRSKTHPVATKQANELGLYDMSGNAWEWCLDRYGPYGGDAQDPEGPANGSFRVARGGCWFNSARDCRPAFRNYCPPDRRNFGLGFRLALVPAN